MAHVGVVIGNARGEHVEISVIGREGGLTGDYDDDNWINSVIAVRVRGFSGRYQASLRSDDFTALQAALRDLIAGAGGSEWVPLEPWIELRFVQSGTEFNVVGLAREQLSEGNSLRFTLRLSAVGVSATLRAIDALLAKYPLPS